MSYRMYLSQHGESQVIVRPDDGNDFVGSAAFATKDELIAAEDTIMAGLKELNTRSWPDPPDPTDVHYTHVVDLVITGPGSEGNFKKTSVTIRWDIGPDAWDAASVAVDEIGKAAGLREIG